tara:strand:- start:284 stop:772 length:489 start_codon:yes stop_codon:yes gene_type:complete
VITYEQFIRRIDKQGMTMDQKLDRHIKRLRATIKLRAIKEVSLTGWPNKITGDLMRSIRVDSKRTAEGLELRLQAGEGLKTGSDGRSYAVYVEKGTRPRAGNRGIQARRYLYRTIRSWQRNQGIGQTTPYSERAIMSRSEKAFDMQYFKKLLGAVLGAQNAR